MAQPVHLAFETKFVVLTIVDILPLRQLKPTTKATAKYQQILSSIREVGVIEPIVVFPNDQTAGTYVLLDGHLRLEALKDLGRTQAECMIATDDETYTYNKRINKMATIQEHKMILRAIENGIPEERIAKVLNIKVARIRQKRDLLDGICKETAEILKTKHIAPQVFTVLKKMKPMRQIEVAELLIATNNFSIPYAKALLAATHQEMLVEPTKRKSVEGLTAKQMAKMTKEMETLQRDLKTIEESHGDEVLNLVLARGYLKKLFDNIRIERYLTQHHGELFSELRAVLKDSSLES
jgi:ParB-like chromosome segregation protein Spo0J